MRVLLIFVLTAFGAAMAFADSNQFVKTNARVVAVQLTAGSTEPVVLLLCGSALLGLAGVMKRFGS